MQKRFLCFFITLFTIVSLSGCAGKNNGPEGGTEDTTADEIKEADIIFSSDSGFYNDDFMLSLTSLTDSDIYYTLDGSIPDKNSPKYTEPIVISDVSSNENVYSARSDTSTGFLEAAGNVFKVPDYLVDKAVIVRAATFDENGTACKPVTRTYFVGLEEKEDFSNMNILSVVADPKDLFDYETGIYVRGKYYDEYDANGRGQWFDAFWWWWTSNYSQEGRDWEREADITLFNENGEILMSTPAGIRIQGGGSRGQAQKSFNIYFRKEFSGSRRLKSDLFGTGYKPHKLTLFAGGDDIKFKLKDYLINNIVSEMNFSTMDFIPCSVFLNGEYWGMYYITEKYDSDYIEFHYGADKDDVIMIKNNGIEEGQEDEVELYNDALKFVEENDMTQAENYNKACELFDMDSTIDYFAALIYAGRYNDWPLTNTALWRSRTTGKEAYHDGRWRWMVFDVNSGGLDEPNRNDDTIWTTRNYNQFFASLAKNKEFQEKFSIRCMDIGNDIYEKNKIKSFIDEWYAEYGNQLKASYKRYYGDANGFTEIENGINSVRNFFDGRLEVMEDRLAANFFLDSDTAQISVDWNEGGSVSVNTINIKSDENTWQGLYLTAYPISIKAIAQDGYIFDGWEIEGIPDGSNDEKFIYDWQNGDIHITAKFKSVN